MFWAGFVSWVGDHRPRHVHVFRDSQLIVKWLSTREIIRRLGTSATQFYRLIDQTNYRKSVGQMISLLSVLNCDVDLVVRERRSA